MINKGKKILGLILLLSLSLSVVGCSKDSNEESGESKTARLELGEYELEIKDSEIFEAWEGDISLKVIADFTNNSETEQSFSFSGIIADGYQDGTPVDRLPTGISGLESMDELVAPGETKEIAFGFSLLDDTTPVTLEIQDYLGGGSEVFEETINLK